MSVASVVTTELDKQFRRPRTYTAIGLVCADPDHHDDRAQRQPARARRRRVPAAARVAVGPVHPRGALRFTSEFMLVIVVAIFGGEAIAGEAQWGNLRYLLMRPIGRGRLFVGKLIVAVVSALASRSPRWSLVGLVAGGIAFGLDPIEIPFGFFADARRPVRCCCGLVFAALFVAWTLTSIVTFSFLVGCMTDSTGGPSSPGSGSG